jgi:tryptophan 2,3-dioxygenase
MALTYSSYLKVDRLLDLQRPVSDPEEHDELLFIIVHQSYELWFKQILHELDRVKSQFSSGDGFGALSTMKRIRMILKTAVGMVDILETLTPLSFASFRDRLETASGFQSAQFRELEFVLGNKRPEMLASFPNGSRDRARLEGRLGEPSVVDHFYDYLVTRGAELPDELRARPVAESNQPSDAVQDAIVTLYREDSELALLVEAMTDVDEGLQEWRYRHVKLAERTIGNKRGTGGSSGVEFLKRALFKPVFPDLWEIRSRF